MIARSLIESMLSPSQCGRVLDRTEATVLKFIKIEGLPATKIGRNYFVHEADLREWRSRPEIALMLALGERVRAGIRGERRREREQSAQSA